MTKINHANDPMLKMHDRYAKTTSEKRSSAALWAFLGFLGFILLLWLGVSVLSSLLHEPVASDKGVIPDQTVTIDENKTGVKPDIIVSPSDKKLETTTDNAVIVPNETVKKPEISVAPSTGLSASPQPVTIEGVAPSPQPPATLATEPVTIEPKADNKDNNVTIITPDTKLSVEKSDSASGNVVAD